MNRYQVSGIVSGRRKGPHVITATDPEAAKDRFRKAYSGNGISQMMCEKLEPKEKLTAPCPIRRSGGKGNITSPASIAVVKVLTDEPKTVAELVRDTGMTKKQVLYSLSGLRRNGSLDSLSRPGQRGQYVRGPNWAVKMAMIDEVTQ